MRTGNSEQGPEAIARSFNTLSKLIGAHFHLQCMPEKHAEAQQEAVLYCTVDRGSMVGLLEKNVRN